MLLSSTTGCSAQAARTFMWKKKKKGTAILYKAELAKQETNSRGMNDKSHQA